MYVCARELARVCVCVYVCVYMCVCVCVYLCVSESSYLVCGGQWVQVVICKHVVAIATTAP